MDRPHSHRQRQPRGQELRHAIKVIGCGGMIGTALLFPLANAEGLWFRAVTLSIFTLSALGFHALHLEPFVRFGPFTAAAALVLLFLAVLAAGPSRKELTPWLPLFIASLSLITVAIYEISRHIGPCPLSVSADDEFSGVAIDTGSERSLRTISTQQGPWPLPESTRMDPLYFARHGPSSRASHRTGTDGTEISLSGVVGQRQPQWDAHTQSYFLNNTLPEQDPTGEPHVRSASPEGESSPDLDFDLDSEDETVEASRPLLGRQ